MRVLLDTHIVLWKLTADPALPKAADDLILDDANTVFVSAVSIWEVAIKHALQRGGPGDVPLSGQDFLAELVTAGIVPMAISGEHAAMIDTIPRLHNDPFDRLLLAQSKVEQMTLLTHDKELARYELDVVVV